MTPLAQWLSEATRGLSPESAAQVRAEIQEHYDAASEAGEDAIAALGDPRAANRGYRKVLLTEQEAMLAPVMVQRKKPALSDLLVAFLLLGPVVWLFSVKRHSPGLWPLMAAMCCTIPLAWFFPATTLNRSRVLAYVKAAQAVLVAGVGWWYDGWIFGLFFGGLFFAFDYFLYRARSSVFRKLEAGQKYGPLPEEPRLTHLEAIVLRRLQKGEPYEKQATVVLFMMIGGMTVLLPATFVPMTAWLIAVYVGQRTLPIYTEERSYRFRVAKWSAMGVAAVLPLLYGARIPWSGAILMTFLFWVCDMKNIAIRRKLPVAQWPRKLYW